MIPADMVSLYKMMLKIRFFEERIVELYPFQEMKTPVHLCIGEEAIAAGVCKYLKKEDYLFQIIVVMDTVSPRGWRWLL